ncbi:MAG: histidine kinase dimerization/phospho-acceptor domain-containing protein [Rheinheimera sp.]|nr:histidine kinase dimerization/phospho-acceptor domain-containing protein [Rheinheimera sp.]
MDISNMNNAKDPQQLQQALLQSERMASLGQLVAGIAHELNNPIGFILSNLNSFQVYLAIFTKYIRLLEQLKQTTDEQQRLEVQQQIAQLQAKEDIQFLLQDSAELLSDSIIGAGRVRDLVLDLRRFSHPDQTNWQATELHALIHATLRLARNELKHHVKVELDFAEPELWLNAQPSGISQVLMNMLINASQAIGDHDGTLCIRTLVQNGEILLSIIDSGCGISADALPYIFDPFFTTRRG